MANEGVWTGVAGRERAVRGGEGAAYRPGSEECAGSEGSEGRADQSIAHLELRQQLRLRVGVELAHNVTSIPGAAFALALTSDPGHVTGGGARRRLVAEAHPDEFGEAPQACMTT